MGKEGIESTSCMMADYKESLTGVPNPNNVYLGLYRHIPKEVSVSYFNHLR